MPGPILSFLAQAGLRPGLDAYFSRVRAMPEGVWPARPCPWCGGPPAFVELVAGGRRRLSCHLCGGAWAAAAPGCAFCGTVEPGAVVALTDETLEAGDIVEACRSCRSYLKGVDRRRRFTAGSPLVEDWSTPDLDVRAMSRGYRRPTPSLAHLLDDAAGGGARVMNAVLFDVALTAYILAAVAAAASLAGRREGLMPFVDLVAGAGWVCHTVSLAIRWVETGRPPILSLAEAVSIMIWTLVAWLLWAERRYHARVLGVFVLPVVLVLGLLLPTGLRAIALPPTAPARWTVAHVSLALVGLAALVVNFAGALMYLLQERQLKAKRPGTWYYRLPSLETLDRLTYRTLTVGFPFLTAGIVLGIVGRGTSGARRFPSIRSRSSPWSCGWSTR